MPKVQKSNQSLSVAASVASQFHFEMDKVGRGFSLICNGVVGISEFSECEVGLKLRGFSIAVLGNGLFVTVLEGKTVEICGKISEVKLIYGKT